MSQNHNNTKNIKPFGVSKIQNTPQTVLVTKRPGPKSKTEIPIKTQKLHSEIDPKASAAASIDKVVDKDKELLKVRQSYKVQIWLDVTDINNPGLRVHTVTNKWAVCPTYKKVEGEDNVYTYLKVPPSKKVHKFVLWFQVWFEERADSKFFSAKNAAEAYCYLLTRHVLAEYDTEHNKLIEKDKQIKLTLAEESNNINDSHHLQQWGSTARVKIALNSIAGQDCFEIVINKQLKSVFGELDIRVHNFFGFRCDKIGAQKVIKNLTGKALAPTPKNIRTITNFHCILCNTYFNALHTLNVHILRIHPGVKAFQCELCAFTSNHKEKYDSHVLLHSNGFICKICNLPFGTKNARDKHNRDIQCVPFIKSNP